MKIQLLFFGIATDLVGKDSMAYTLKEKATVKDLKDALKEAYLGLKNINDFAIAVNETYATDDFTIKEGDTIAVIPPVSGG